MSHEPGSGAFFMAHAIKLARRAWGHTHPNPTVGALVVENGDIVAEGWHKAAGQAHAEVEALVSLGRQASPEGSLYVTLEPCSTRGRTSACVEAIIQAGIRRVVVGATDPNPAHAGAGLDILRDFGVEVVSGALADECADLNLIFNHWIVNREPLVAAKMAMTLDGKFAAASGHSQWVTSKAARENVMEWRRYFPSIAVGANTVIRDDPSLTSRINASVFCPRRFVFDRHLKTAHLPRAPKLFSDAYRANTVVLALDTADEEAKAKLRSRGVELWELPADGQGHLDWHAFRARCADCGICGVYVEAGPALATQVIETHKADYLFVYQAPKFLADSAAHGIGSERQTAVMGEAFELESVRHEVFGQDVLTRGGLKK